MDATEYELGWICYSGQPHSLFPNEQEVVAMIYDGAYFGLQPWDRAPMPLCIGPRLATILRPGDSDTEL
jgi:hypothetical protein